MKKIISVFLAVMMLLGCSSMAFASTATSDFTIEFVSDLSIDVTVPTAIAFKSTSTYDDGVVVEAVGEYSITNNMKNINAAVCSVRFTPETGYKIIDRVPANWELNSKQIYLKINGNSMAEKPSAPFDRESFGFIAPGKSVALSIDVKTSMYDHSVESSKIGEVLFVVEYQKDSHVTCETRYHNGTSFVTDVADVKLPSELDNAQKDLYEACYGQYMDNVFFDDDGSPTRAEKSNLYSWYLTSGQGTNTGKQGIRYTINFSNLFRAGTKLQITLANEDEYKTVITTLESDLCYAFTLTGDDSPAKAIFVSQLND